MSTSQSTMENKICSRIKDLKFSVIREMSQRAAGMENCISLGIGEPDFDTPEQVIQRAMLDVQNGCTHYAPAQGDPELLRLLSQKLSAETKMDVPVSNIVVTPGGMGALSAGLQAVLEPGDEVLIPEPYFPSYKAHVIMAGGRVVPVSTSFDTGFTLRPQDLEQAITPRTKLLTASLTISCGLSFSIVAIFTEAASELSSFVLIPLSPARIARTRSGAAISSSRLLGATCSR
ncbi:MAG: aminotransferase class I/II-fold pyridoxal phosphate-dependent enzyme [Desulfovermiculus sp.]